MDDDYRLAPLDDDDLTLAPITDAEEERPIAPDVSIKSGVKLIPVICTACKTRMYAGENQVGLWKKCPDCYRLTQIPPAEPELVQCADDPDSAAGYELKEPEVGRRETFRMNIDYRTLQLDDDGANERWMPPKTFEDRPPLMERIFDGLLTTKEEKEEKRKALEQERKIEDEVNAVKKAAREGKLEEHLGRNPGDSLAARLEARRRNAEAAAHGYANPPPPPPRSPLRPGSDNAHDPLPPPQSKPTLKVFKGPRTPREPLSPSAKADALFAALDDAIVDAGGRPQPPPRRQKHGLFTPFFDASSRARMIVFVVTGLIGNFFGEKARSMIWQVLIDRVHEQPAGYVYSYTEQGIFLWSFWVGAVATVVWLTIMFLFGISIFLESAKGKDRVENWVPFNLDFGLSYIGWTVVFLTVSGFPGFVIWQGISLIFPAYEERLIVIHFFAQFLCFPLLFLCVIESDTFWGTWPTKTLESLRSRRRLWFRFYLDAAVLVGIPAAILFGLLVVGTGFSEEWWTQSVLYFLAASVVLTCCGFFPMLYFRRLGNLTADIRS